MISTNALAGDFTGTHLPGDDEHPSPRVPNDMSFTHACNLCSFLEMREIISFSICVPNVFEVL